MGKSKRTQLDAEELRILDGFRLVLLSDPEDVAKCDALIVEHHKLHDASLVGEHLRYAAVYRDQWLAVATWSAAARHLKDRDAFIGWTHEQCRRRRALLANNSRLLVLPDCRSPNLVSRFMKLMLDRLSSDWQARWGHPIALVETFVDPQSYRATAYKVSGWSHLGRTAGWKRDATDFYVKHGSSKQIWVRELTRKACVKLRARDLPQEWAEVEDLTPARCTYKVGEILPLMDLVKANLKDFRRSQGLAYPMAGIVCLIVMAMATGIRLGPSDLADYADTLSEGQLRALNFRRDVHTAQRRVPKKTTFGRVLARVDPIDLESVLLRWQEQLLGPSHNPLVVVDGKKLRHGGVEIVNAVDGQGRFLGSAITPDKTNEIPVARELLGRLDLGNKIVLTDALHTNEETAHQILYEQGGDFLMTVKGNQPTLQKTCEKLFEEQRFSPSADGEDPRLENRT